jgi:hypothetical protein
MDIYNSLAATTSASAQTLTGNAGAGALALPRPDGRYLVIHGGGLTTSSLVDPKGFASVVAGPAVTASNAGTVAFKRFDGRFIYTNGGAVTTQIYDIVANTVAAGPSLTTGTAGAGALWLARPDGQALLVVGGATGNSQLYNQSSATGNIGVFAAGPTLGTGCEINGAGSVAFKRQDGKYVVLSKANASTVYDPYLNTFTCSTSNGPATALGDGAHAIPMQNGNFLIVVGGNSTASYVYDPVANTYTSHGTALTAVTTGGFSLMNLDGTWQIFAGGGTASTKLDTGLPMTGSTTLYTSEDISSTALSPRSTIRWTGQYEAAYVGGNAAGQSSNSAYSTLQFFVRTATSSPYLSSYLRLTRTLCPMRGTSAARSMIRVGSGIWSTARLQTPIIGLPRGTEEPLDGAMPAASGKRCGSKAKPPGGLSGLSRHRSGASPSALRKRCPREAQRSAAVEEVAREGATARI